MKKLILVIFFIILCLNINNKTNIIIKYNSNKVCIENYVNFIKINYVSENVINFLTESNITSIVNYSDNYPSLVTAMAILESGWGKYHIDNNYFGIKGKGSKKSTLEWNGLNFNKQNANFKTFDSLDESVDYLSNLLINKYNLQTATCYKSAVNLIIEGGYATDPNYSNKLLYLIEKYELYKLDNIKNNFI